MIGSRRADAVVPPQQQVFSPRTLRDRRTAAAPSSSATHSAADPRRCWQRPRVPSGKVPCDQRPPETRAHKQVIDASPNVTRTRRMAGRGIAVTRCELRRFFVPETQFFFLHFWRAFFFIFLFCSKFKLVIGTDTPTQTVSRTTMGDLCLACSSRHTVLRGQMPPGRQTCICQGDNSRKRHLAIAFQSRIFRVKRAFISLNSTFYSMIHPYRYSLSISYNYYRDNSKVCLNIF